MSKYKDVVESLEMALDKARQLDEGENMDAVDADALDNSLRRHIETARTAAEEIAFETREKKRREKA